MAVTREQFVQWLKAAGGSDEKARQDAERRLAMLPRPFILEHLPPLWKESEKNRVQTHKAFCVLASLFIALFLFAPMVGAILEKYGVAFKFPFPVLGGIIGPMLSGAFTTNARRPESIGMAYVLMQHQYPELVLQLIEALPEVRKANASIVAKGGILHGEIMRVLAALLPRYAALDVADLGEHQEQILRNELRRYNKKLRDSDTVLSSEEGAFLAAVLTFLRRERRKKGNGQTAKVIENLAIERMEISRESRERRQVREAARQAVVRLYT